MRTFPQVMCLLAGFVLALPLAAQLNGVYTCAAGNPGNAFDYGDIGDFFDDLEDFGVSGPVTLDVFDDGGAFTSTQAYCLGVPPNPANPWGVAGLSLANPLVIRAAVGEQPVISGSGSNSPATPLNYTGSLTFVAVGFTTLDGLTIRNGVEWGILWHGDGDDPLSNVRIARCRIHDIIDVSTVIGDAVFFGTDDGASGIDAVVLENNMFWGCTPRILNCAVGLEWIVRHNTILHVNAPNGTNGSAIHFTGEAVQQFHSNIIYLSSTAGPVGPEVAVFNPLPLFADFNVYHALGTARVFGTGTPAAGFTSWQGLGYDLNGSLADPMLVNIAPGQEDLHLQPGSPCINRSLINSVTVDIDGDARPFGPARDSGADEYLTPDMVVEFNAALVSHQGAVAMGGVPQSGASRVFTIRNLGPGQLVLQSPAVAVTPGLNCAVTTVVQAQPATLQLAPNATTTFSVFIDPVTTGAFDLVVAIASNDPLKNPYTFTVTGTGVPPNQPARANLAAGSSFAGGQNGPFQCPMQPGAALANAALDLTDPDADLITILSITPPAVALTGVIPPGIGTPAHPRVLTWTGAVDASNAPGNYTWTIQFQDSVNQSIITINATIQVLNPGPVHVIAAAQGGDGSQPNPYQCGFNRGDDGAASVGLCTVTDPNTSQTPFISQTIKAGTNPGLVNFVFALNAGLLSVSPANMLKVAEAGQHDYEVQVSDGVNLVSIHVLIFVANQPMNFTTPSQLASGETGAPYAATLSVTGAIGAISYTLTTGALPSGLALDAAGQISGTPTQAETAGFTVEATDTTGATASRSFQLTISDPATPPPPNPRAKASNGCAPETAASIWPVVLAALGALRRRRRAS